MYSIYSRPILRYEDLVRSFEKNPRNLQTYTKEKTKANWFYVYVDAGEIYIDQSKLLGLTSNIQSKRHLASKEFSPMFELYIRREQGAKIAVQARTTSRNASYWFAVIHSVIDEQNRNKKNQNDLRFKKHIIVYVDILGYTNLIEGFKSEQMFLEYIHEALESAFNYVKFKNKRNLIKKHIFSDNCIFAVDIEDCSDKQIEYRMLLLFQFTSMFQQFLAIQRMIYIRGGMTFGNLYMSRNIGYVTGTGLINAYNIEKDAIYPRIVITNEIYDFAKNKKDLGIYMVVDLDKKVFLGYLTYLTKMLVNIEWDDTFSPLILDMLLLHKQSILHAIDTFGKEEKIFIKYQWVARYHNIWCKVRGLDKFSIAATGEEKFLISSSITDWTVQGSLL